MRKGKDQNKNVHGDWVMGKVFSLFILSKFSTLSASYFYNVGENFLMKTLCFDLLLE